MDWVGLAGVLVGFAAISISVYAILDVRKQVRNLLEIERERTAIGLMNDMAWALYLDPVESTTYPPAVAKGMISFGLLAHALNPSHTPETLVSAMEKESLALADEIVQKGQASWKHDLSHDAIQRELDQWRADKNAIRIRNLLGNK